MDPWVAAVESLGHWSIAPYVLAGIGRRSQSLTCDELGSSSGIVPKIDPSGFRHTALVAADSIDEPALVSADSIDEPALVSVDSMATPDSIDESAVGSSAQH